MYILAKLVFQSYIPEQLVPGMMFQQRIKDVVFGRVYEYDRIFLLNHTPNDIESYVSVNGYPVMPYVYTLTSNPDANANILAAPDQIGWWDEGSHSDELRDIELKDFNYILQEEDGYIEIEVNALMNEDDDEIVTPILYMNKVTIRSVTDEESTYDDEDDEDWDDMDDLTDYDNPEWIHDHPKDKNLDQKVIDGFGHE
jgi:hypothetical protein